MGETSVSELAAADQKQICLCCLKCLQEDEKVALFIERILQGRSHGESQLLASGEQSWASSGF